MTSSRSALLLLLGLAAPAAAQDVVQISLGVRETGFAGGTWIGLGADGGSGGGIEWIAKDVQTLTLDGTWQFFQFDLTNDPITGFAGTSANSMLEGDHGTLEQIRVLNTSGRTAPITLWIDDIVQTQTPTGGTPTSTVLEDFDFYNPGQAVMFQRPGYSGSTSGNVLVGDTTGVDTTVGSRSVSNRFDFSFSTASPTGWVRLTTFNAPTLPNPQIRFDDNCVISFWLRGGVDQPDLGAQGPGTAVAEMVGTGLSGSTSSTYDVGLAPPNSPGLLFVSLDGFPDVPLAGGTLVSGTANLSFFTIASDPFGHLSVSVPGSPFQVDLVVQTIFLDPNLPGFATLTNAVRARYGR